MMTLSPSELPDGYVVIPSGEYDEYMAWINAGKPKVRGRPMTADDYIIPPELAKIWKCTSIRILEMIRRGELKAFTLSAPGTKKPHWRIRKDAVEEFEKRRDAATPEALPATRSPHRYVPSKGLIKFF